VELNSTGSEEERGLLGRVHVSGSEVTLGRGFAFLLIEKKLLPFACSASSGSTDRKLSSLSQIDSSCFGRFRKLERLSLPGDTIVGGTCEEEKLLVPKAVSSLKCEIEVDRRSFHRMLMSTGLSSGWDRDRRRIAGRTCKVGDVSKENSASEVVSVIDSSGVTRGILRLDELRLQVADGRGVGGLAQAGMVRGREGAATCSGG